MALITPTSLQAVHQYPADLALGVLTTELPFRPTIFTYRTIAAGAAGQWRFQFHIIGESHLVRIQHNNRLVLQEILACVDLPSSACAYYHRFNDLSTHRYHRHPYEIAVSFTRQADAHDLPEASDVLEAAFPAVHGQTPITRLGWRAQRNAMIWWTLHTYPDETSMMQVQSASQFLF